MLLQSQVIYASESLSIRHFSVLRVCRCQATHCLTKVANAIAASWEGPPAMMVIFIVRANLQTERLLQPAILLLAKGQSENEGDCEIEKSEKVCESETRLFTLDFGKNQLFVSDFS